MNILWKDKFIFWNLIILILLKVGFSFSGFEYAQISNSLSSFSGSEVVSQTNVFRSRLGLNTLSENQALDAAAAAKLQDMISQQYFAHFSPAGTSPWHWIDANNYKYSYAGENLAIGFMNAKDTVDAWINSSSHRENLVNSHYKEIGVAVAKTKIQNDEGFLVVQMFGTPRSAVAVRNSIPVTSPVKPIATPKKTPLPATVAIITPIPTTPSSLSGFLAPSPVLSPSVTPTSQPVVKAATSQGNSEKPIAITKTSPETSVIKILNRAFVFYMLLVFIALVLMAIMSDFKRSQVTRAALGLAIFLLAIVIPELRISHQGLILGLAWLF